jgi:large subunit ribosomal protein L22
MEMTKNLPENNSVVVSSSKQRFILQTPRKLRRSSDMIRGLSYVKAIQLLRFSRLRASQVILKKLTEAASNAVQQKGVSLESLFVSQISVDEGPVYKRFKPRAQGRMYTRLKRSSHITVQLGVKG